MSEPPNFPPPPPPPAGGQGYPPSPGNYGYPPSGPGGHDYPTPQKAGTNGMAIASLVCSLVPLFWVFLIGPILGLILGRMALRQIKETGQNGRGMAIAGMVIGGVLIGLCLLALIAQLFIDH